MASVKIYEKRPVFTKKIEQEFSIKTSIVSAPSKNVAINSTLPFRIRLTAIRIEAGGASAVPPIPLQIIGYSNYIL
jgi:hypothetical protein